MPIRLFFAPHDKNLRGPPIRLILTGVRAAHIGASLCLRHRWRAKPLAEHGTD
jgi:hypothetical protein